MPLMEIFDRKIAVETLKLLEMAKRERHTKKQEQNWSELYDSEP